MLYVLKGNHLPCYMVSDEDLYNVHISGYTQGSDLPIVNLSPTPEWEGREDIQIHRGFPSQSALDI